jgi:chromosomal replication initiator protein
MGMDVSAKELSSKDRVPGTGGGLSEDKRWEKVRARLRDEVGEAAFKSWLAPVDIKDIRDGRLRLNAPSRMVRDWVQTHYADRIRSLWGQDAPGVHKVEVSIAAPRAKVPPIPETVPAVVGRNIEAREAAREAGAPAPVLASDADRDGLGAQLDPRYTFENFVVGKPNEFAHAAARRVAESKTPAFNPLFLYGGVGLGKTHLMHAIAWEIRQRDPSRSVLYLSAEKFMYRFVRALRDKTITSFKEQFRSVDVLMIDDVQFICGKDSTQEEFFHTFNALVDMGRQIVVSADKSPSDLEGLEERLRSRLGCGLVADIHATSYELRLGILQSKADQMGVDVPPKVIEFLAHKITSNVRELEGALRRVAAHAQLVGRPITLENTQEVLHDILRASDRRITIEDIQKRVAEHFNIRLSDMSSARRARAVARPRQVAMYLAKQLTSRSLPEIGRKFGGRDHTTVIHAVRKVEELTSRDHAFAEDVELLRRMLEG